MIFAVIPLLLWTFVWDEGQDLDEEAQFVRKPPTAENEAEQTEDDPHPVREQKIVRSLMDEAMKKQIQRNIENEFKHEKINLTSAVKLSHSGLILKRKKILLLSSPRTGSTFLTELIAAFPGVFVHFNPFELKKRHFDYKDEADETKAAYEAVDRAAMCHSDQDHFDLQRERFVDLLKRNPRYRSLCTAGSPQAPNAPTYIDDRCLEADFGNQVCSLFPITLVKSTSLKTGLAMNLLDLDTDLSLILLHRDPRGVLNSQTRLLKEPTWQKKNNLIKAFCRREDEDVLQASALAKLFPSRVHLIRYEDLTMDTEAEVKALFRFLGLPLTISVKSYVQSHTLPYRNPAEVIPPPGQDPNQDDEDPFSTMRRTYENTFRWEQQIDPDLLEKVEKECKDSMKILGYKK